MSKITWFVAFLSVSVMMTFLVDTYYNSLTGIGVPTIIVPGRLEVNNISDLWNAVVNFFSIYMRIAFFQIPDLPFLFNIFFIVSNAGMIYTIIK
jgi:uncharacterized protein (DUF58 family)